MSESNQKLRQARLTKQKQLVAGVVFLGLFGALLVGILTGMRSTDIIVTPEDAAAGVAITVSEGIGFTISDKVYAFPGATLGGVTVAISSPGYFTQSRSLSELKSSYLEVAMSEKPATLVLVTKPLAPNTRWYISDELVGQGSEKTIERMSGAYTIEARNPFYSSRPVQVEVVRGKRREISISLQTISGTLNVSSEPSGVEVFLDGSPAGSTQLSVSITGGQYELELRHPDYDLVKEKLLVTREKPHLRRAYRLIPRQATLVFDLRPKSGELFVDGRLIQTPELSLSSLTSHRVSFRRAGYKQYSTTVTLKPGQKEKLTIHLEEEFGRVLVESDPTGQVYVDGKISGKTPLALNLSAVPHEIIIRREGYHSMSQTVVPDAREEKSIVARLLTELEYLRQTTPVEYVNSADITLVRFQPDSFTMGAARGEKGQRANEFLREVSLTKEFYISTTEVTRAQYAKFNRANPASGNEPQTDITWNEAANFCNWLSDVEKLKPVYRFNSGRYVGADMQADGYRLPTEAEWEWVARKANRKNQSRFTWGNSYSIPKSSGNLADEDAKNAVTIYIPGYSDGFEKLAPVGSFQREKSGIYDLSGNASEWVHDYYQLSASGSKQTWVNPTGPDWGEGHVYKGSSWRSATATQLRASFRDSVSGTRDDLGFRVARFLYGGEHAKQIQ